jgi:hypothetical protein
MPDAADLCVADLGGCGMKPCPHAGHTLLPCNQPRTEHEVECPECHGRGQRRYPGGHIARCYPCAGTGVGFGHEFKPAGGPR